MPNDTNITNHAMVVAHMAQHAQWLGRMFPPEQLTELATQLLTMLASAKAANGQTPAHWVEIRNAASAALAAWNASASAGLVIAPAGTVVGGRGLG
ncbi:MAG TPA: hypothetical protein VHH11_13890 [Gammaproteobacteria bacterium]|nr:hypothetical protein [Gammaproteobacteria bacterium]